MTITTTLRAIRKHRPCQPGWENLLTNLGKTKADDEPLEMVRILESNGLEDALWCLRALGQEHHKLIVSLACDFAERALKFAPEGELRPAECLHITRLWIDGKSTIEDVRNAANAAYAAYSAAYADAAYAAASAANAANAAANAANAAANLARAFLEMERIKRRGRLS